MPFLLPSTPILRLKIPESEHIKKLEPPLRHTRCKRQSPVFAEFPEAFPHRSPASRATFAPKKRKVCDKRKVARHRINPPYGIFVVFGVELVLVGAFDSIRPPDMAHDVDFVALHFTKPPIFPRKAGNVRLLRLPKEYQIAKGGFALQNGVCRNLR